MSDPRTLDHPSDLPARNPSSGERTVAVPDPDATLGPFDLSWEPVPPVATGRYELGEEIARGGMGVVYRARDTVFDREVAVKVLQVASASTAAAAAARFLHEARITGQLQHPAIPPAHDVGTLADGRPFLAMKLVEGDTLDDLLDARPDPTTERGRFVAIFEQVCQAVAYAHARGVIHRDLKPANVMVGRFGEVQVMDWGLAKALTDPPTEPTGWATATDSDTRISTRLDSAAGFTQAGSVLGTPAFMPPEQAVGEVDAIDERADVFGLGAVLAVVLTGQPPYLGSDPDRVRVMAARGEIAAGLARLDACGAEPELVALCQRCLALNPADRPPGAGVVAEAVAALRAAAEDRARRAEVDRVRAVGERAAADARATEQRKRRGVQAVLGMALTAVVALVGVGLWWREHERSAATADQAARASRTAASVSAALGDARGRIEEAWTLTDEPDKMRTATDLALAAVRRADGFANAGEPTPDVLADADVVRRAAEELDRHTRLFVAADLALRTHDLGPTGHPDGRRTTDRLSAAFRAFGWDPVRSPPAAMADRIVAGRAANKVLGFLCDWEFQGPDAATQRQIRECIRHARLRSGGPLATWQEVMDRGDRAGLSTFAARPEVLTIGPELLCALGRDLKAANKTEDRLRLMRRAADQYPTHVWINFDLMEAYQSTSPPRPAEALRYAAAAAAARPDSAMLQDSLATALLDLGATESAIEVYRKALALVPNSARSLAGLSRALERAGKPAEAVAAYREILRLDPTSAAAHYNLGTALAARGEAAEAMAAYEEAARLDPKRYGAAAADFRLRARARQAGLTGHQKAVTAVAFTPDGRVVSASEDGTVRVWDPATRRELWTVRAEPACGITALAVRANPLVPGVSQVAAGTTDGRILVWQPGRRAPVATFRGPRAPVRALAVGPDGKALLSASDDGAVRVWDLVAGRLTRTLSGHAGPVIGLAVRSDGKQAASVGIGGELILWDLVTGGNRVVAGATTGDAVAYSPDGRALATGGPALEVRLWDPSTAKPVRQFPGAKGVVLGLAFSPDGRLLAGAGMDRSIRLWDVQAGTAAEHFDGHASPVRRVAFSPDGRTLASAGADALVGLWQVPPAARNPGPSNRMLGPMPREVKE